MAKTLVIVESPAKARTIERILKDGYEVLASYGHVRDLPESASEIPDEIRKKKWGRLGVDTDGDFTPYYVIPNDKKKHMQALKAASDVDENLVRAQESRRILDRLYGYTLSPVLWKKVQTGLSAGRVQSVAVRLIVEREEERRAFRASVYWDLEAKLKGEGREFIATLARINDQRIASGKDFDPKTGELK